MRNLNKLKTNVFDVLIIGAGAHGATAAYHASKAGLKIAIIDQDDFCGATSANSLKIIHGGLRYLQHGNIKRMRHSILARREMMQIAPHLVKPLACLMPTAGYGLRSKRLMQLALLLNDCIGLDRNRGISQEVKLPGGHVVSKKECQRIVPLLDDENLTGGAVWYDCLASDTERVILEYILKSIDHGAEAANYVKASCINKTNESLYLVDVTDQITKEEFQVKTKTIVNAAGPWFEKTILCDKHIELKQKWSIALNIVSKKKIFNEYAVALEGMTDYQDKDALLKRGKRLYFFVPWENYTMIGTEYKLCNENPGEFQVKAEYIQEMIDGVNSIYPQADLKYEDISFYHAGLMPIQDESTENNIQLEKNSSFFEQHDQDFANVISIRGVKFTTAPYIAHEVVALLKKKLQSFDNTEKSKQTQIGYIGENDRVMDELKSTYPFLLKRYGKRSQQVIMYLQKEEGRDIWVDQDARLLKAEVRYLVEDEFACKLSDIILRRTGIGTAERPDRPLLEKISQYMGSILGWSGPQCAEEIETVLDRYKPLI